MRLVYTLNKSITIYCVYVCVDTFREVIGLSRVGARFESAARR